MSTGTITTALLIEDDNRLAQLTSTYLEGHGFVVTTLSHGDQGLAQALRHPYDIILLDIMLPGLDGIRVCQTLRSQSDVPIILLTARGEEADRVMGLEVGADDYMVKPYSPRELLARIRALLRRSRGQAGPALKAIRVGELVVDPAACQAILAGDPIPLTAYEFAILKALAERAGRVLSRERLMELAKGNSEESFDRSIDVHISRLRQKLELDPKRPKWIKTVRGMGYLMATPADQL